MFMWLVRLVEFATLTALLTVSSSSVDARELLGESLSRTLAPATDAAEWDADGKLARKDFRFSDTTIWLRSNGAWHLEGQVSHGFLLCGTYQIGVRFGAGHPGCSNVEWLTDTEYATSHVQCNHAIQWHAGSGTLTIAPDKFSEMTCAERSLKCSGRCP
jgi:hypothetical protein